MEKVIQHNIRLQTIKIMAVKNATTFILLEILSNAFYMPRISLIMHWFYWLSYTIVFVCVDTCIEQSWGKYGILSKVSKNIIISYYQKTSVY